MKEINKVFFLGCFLMSLLSCKIGELVSFESSAFEEFKNEKNVKSEKKDIIFSRIMTTTCVDFIFRKFSLDETFEDLSIENIKIFDDKERLIYDIERLQLKSNGINHELNNYNCQLYTYEIYNEELRLKIKNLKTKYLIINFEIEGKVYTDKLNRDVERYPLLRT